LKKRKLAGCLLIVSLCCMLTTGCWSRIELNELAITSATGVDQEGEEYVVSFQVVIPATISAGIGITGNNAGSPVVVYSTKGRTIREANSRSFFESPRKLFFAHNRIIVISEATARRGLDSIVEVYLRNTDARETVDVLITPGSARRLLEQLMQIERIPGAGIREIIRMESEYMSALPEVRMYELAMQLADDSKSALIPEIIISGGKDNSSLQDFQRTTLPSKVRLGRLAVISKNKQIGWLSRREALGTAFLRNQINQTPITVACKEEPSKYLTVLVGKSKTTLSPSVQNGKLVVDAAIEARGGLTQTDCRSVDLYDPVIIQQLEAIIATEVKSIAEAGWKAARKLNTDVVKFAELAHRSFPADWRTWKTNWEQVFPETKVTINAKFTLVNVGLSNKSFRSTELNKNGD
jgi:spore germination protein KC